MWLMLAVLFYTACYIIIMVFNLLVKDGNGERNEWWAIPQRAPQWVFKKPKPIGISEGRIHIYKKVQNIINGDFLIN